MKRVYLGDYVDRGTMSTEIVITLCCMKVNEPEKIIMLRGNHESQRSISNKEYTLKDECFDKYSFKIFKEFMDLLDYLPLACYVHWSEGNFFCCHGGIPFTIPTIEEINKEDRFHEVPCEGIINDLLWSDPIDN